jgi:hypothetical protein
MSGMVLTWAQLPRQPSVYRSRVKGTKSYTRRYLQGQLMKLVELEQGMPDQPLSAFAWRDAKDIRIGDATTLGEISTNHQYLGEWLNRATRSKTTPAATPLAVAL